MSDTETETETETETTPVAETAKPVARRGRPRPNEVITRDERVFEALTTSMTRRQVAEATGFSESHTYLSLIRLRSVGRIQRTHAAGTQHLWTRVETTEPTEGAAPVE